MSLTEEDEKQLQERLPKTFLSQLVQVDGVLRRGLGAGLCVIVVIALVATSPQNASTALQRFLLPFGSAEWPRSTEHTAVLNVMWWQMMSTSLSVSTVSMGPAGPLRFSWESPSGERDSSVLPALRGPWRELLSLDRGSYEFQVDGNDAVPLYLKANVVERPMAVLRSVTLTPPAYTKQPAQQLQSLSGATLLPGTRVEAEFQLRRSPLRSSERSQYDLCGTNA